MEPLVSIIVPTYNRHELLLNRCLPSIFRQTYPKIEIIVVSDGPDNWLREYFAEKNIPNLKYYELSRNWGLCGGWGKHFGSFVVNGDLIGYLDDDDEYTPEHVFDLVTLQQSSGVDFVYSMMFGWNKDGAIVCVGNGVPDFMTIGTPMILHKYDLFRMANWSPIPECYDEDWRLIKTWIQKGATFAFNQKVSVLLRGATLRSHELLRSTLAPNAGPDFYVPAEKFNSLKMIFDFSEIKDILYNTTINHYQMPVPLPYMKRRSRYKVGPVPHIIHFTWTGSVVPEKYVENICRFRDNNPKHTVVLWVDHDTPNINGVLVRKIDVNSLVNKDIYEKIRGVSVKNDLLRMELIYKYGGIYSDIDAISVKEFDGNFDKPFLAYEPHSWLYINSSILGFSQGDEFMGYCLFNVKNHFKWITENKPDWFVPHPSNVMRLCSGIYLMMCLFAFEDVSELQFINQDYLIQQTGYGYTFQTMDGNWFSSLSQIPVLYEV